MERSESTSPRTLVGSLAFLSMCSFFILQGAEPIEGRIGEFFLRAVKVHDLLPAHLGGQLSRIHQRIQANLPTREDVLDSSSTTGRRLASAIRSARKARYHWAWQGA